MKLQCVTVLRRPALIPFGANCREINVGPVRVMDNSTPGDLEELKTLQCSDKDLSTTVMAA